MTIAEQQRFVKRYGRLQREGKTWTWVAAPDTKNELREVQSNSRIRIVETVYNHLTGKDPINP